MPDKELPDDLAIPSLDDQNDSFGEAQSALAAIVSPEIRPTPRGESLERFLARLPDRWREEQGQVGKEPRVKPPRHWRTRKDPFEGVWCEVLGWLQEDPDASAIALLGRLQEAVSRVNYICRLASKFCRFTSFAWPRCWAASVR